MKLLKVVFAMVLSFGLWGCSKPVEPIDLRYAKSCELKLVGYRTSKASYYWMEEVETKAIFTFRGLGGRRIPTIALGSTVQSKCSWVGHIRVTQWQSNKRDIVKNPHTGTTEFRTLNGYRNKVSW
jgi:hypothetical protein